MNDIKVKGVQEVSFEEKEGILYRVFKHPRVNQGSQIRQVFVPQVLRNQVMQVAHDSLLGGHLGIKKTRERILTNFYWPGLNRDVTEFCKTCDICQKTVHKGTVHKVPLGKMPVIDVPFKRVAVDIVGPIDPPSEGGYRYILTLVDYATRYPEAVPLKKITAESVAEALVNMYSRFGIPDEILSDRGTQFMSECMKEVSRLLGIRQLATTPYHPMCNGLVEKFNGTLKTMLRRLPSEQPKQWHRNKLDQTLQIAQEELQKSQKRYKHYYDRRAKPLTFQVGDSVLVLLPTNNNKLLMQWKGPYTVESVVALNDYQVRMNGKLKTMHANLLKQYTKREPLKPNTSQISGAFERVGVSVVHKDELTENDEIDDNLLELHVCKPRESPGDVQFGPELPTAVKQQLQDIVHKYSMVFTDLPH